MTAKQHVVRLTPDERFWLGRLIRRKSTTSHEQRRARVLLLCDVGHTSKRMTDVEVAAVAEIAARSVARIRAQYAEVGLEATVRRRKRVDVRPRKLAGEAEARLITLCTSEPPEGHARWTLKLLANRLVELEIVDGVSPETVRTALKKTA